jgi:hypothetical protein
VVIRIGTASKTSATILAHLFNSFLFSLSHLFGLQKVNEAGNVHV